METKTYYLFQPLGGALNDMCKAGAHEYENVANCPATDLEDAFSYFQNFNPIYSQLSLRSACIGDLIVCEDDLESHYMVVQEGMEKGFKKVIMGNSPETKTQKSCKNFELNGDMAQQFNDTYPGDEDDYEEDEDQFGI